jgi:hypothetical protein
MVQQSNTAAGDQMTTNNPEDEPDPKLVDAVENVLLKLLIDGGYLAAKNRRKRQAILNAYESWMVDVRIEREASTGESRTREIN